MTRYFAFASLLVLTGCASTGNVPASGTAFKLDGCSPFLNCVSSESSVGLYKVQPIALTQPLDPSSWDRIKSTALELPGASLEEARYGYANITYYSDFFGFPDFLEILVADDGQHLNVRSQSMLGFYDLGVNRARVERLRERLAAEDIARGAAP
ncbi:DUF1499 domain-containing protein [Marinobacter koreensis]|uniref:DUF1499 domain-containing protein n=1 Tax=Marinobacter koreensis TaxID=335974 RepID=A0ABW0RIN0_9GAMM|nr:DUF1499 domain-containing protein [Marinobacter koreensis]MCK7548383.1 DUF1499 domain-containing protein [Marinobacter koreensis]